MEFKLDENFGRRTQHLFQIAGHDVQTTLDENIQGCPDQHVYQGGFNLTDSTCGCGMNCVDKTEPLI